MGPLALAVIALLGWMWWTGRLKRITGQDAMAIAMGVLGLVLLVKGRPLLGVAPALLTGLYALWRFNRPEPKTRVSEATPVAMDVAEARALLGVDESADPDEIRAAYRRLIALTHPDRGGTEALAGRINAARDVLLRHHGEK